MSCNLEVDVNGHETFFVKEKVVTYFSGRFRKLFEKSTCRGLKVIFHEFPGGAEGFELIVRFCYNGGRIGITPSNVLLLHSAANFVKVNDLIDQTKVFLESIHQWSCRLSSSLSTIWFRDLEFLSVELFEKVAKTMILMKLDHETISSFLNYYQRMKFRSLSSSGKCKFIVIVINLLCSLDGIFFSFRSLCNMLQVSFTLKITKSSTKKLECLIGSRLDEATLDDLLVPSPPKKSHAYDVNLVLRFLKTFLEDSRKHLVLRRLKKVAHLMDLYITEVAPDPHLKPSKFRALVFGLPDFARDSHDRIYEAMDMYFRVHNYLYEEEKMKICRVLNYDKLSSDSLIHLSQNATFPAKDKGQFGMNMQKVKKCRKRQIKAASAKKFDVNGSNSGRSLPRLCS
ncbi:BTB/POZ domain-containing protein [Abeliophyllum distichum]|uniref:BTB/POZ domain-containing protein n=1 Tax=Abeliophyllum distichum TaxID=126358 RepID=A0ABD1T181_9LAMI